MKGTFFQKPLEFRLSVEGETWRQGDPIQGSLTVKNHAPQEIPIDRISVSLARGALKKVHEKSAGAFEILSSISAPASAGKSIETQKELSFPWKFETERNFAITDSMGSPFLLYGIQGPAGGTVTPGALDTAPLGQLQIPILPYEVITQFLDVLKTAFRFVLKGTRWSKGTSSVEAKLAPPDGRGFATLEQLITGFRFEGESLEVHYQFKLKKVEASAASVELRKQETAFARSYDSALYRMPSGRFDHERVEKEIREVLDRIESKVHL